MGKTKKLLYIDDEVINLTLFQMQFKKKYKVLTANNGYKGLQVLQENSDIDIIISDMNMPQMNGLEFIKKAKKDYPEKKFYILTGYEITEEIEEALKSGLIIKYFSKPFLASEIEKVLEYEVYP